MRLSLLIPILMVLGMGCVVHDPDYGYTTGYVAYDPGYSVYYSDGYYYSYYGDGWYLWQGDRWIVSPYRPRSPVVVTTNHGGHGYPTSTAGLQVRDHRTSTRASRGWSRSAPRVRSAPAPRMRVRDHRR